MTNQELINYIKQQMGQGIDKEEIKKELLAVGWGEKDIEEAFNITGIVQPPGPSVSSPPVQEEVSVPSTLPIVENLLKRAFSVYKARLGTFVGIVFFSFILGIFTSLLSNIIPGFVGTLFSFIVRIASIFINFWISAALIFAIKNREEKIGIVESLGRAWQKIFSFAWVSILVGFITAGGYGLFIIPGIIFSVWFVFSTYVLVSEDLRGMNAIFRSKQLVAGYWWKVLWRFFIIGVIVFVPIILFFGVFVLGLLLNFNHPVLIILLILSVVLFSLFIPPFIAVFIFLLYEDLKKQKAQITFEPPKKGTKIKFILIGIFGLLLIPIISFFIILFSLREAGGRAQDAMIVASMNQLRPIMEIYSMKNNYSYSGADCSLVELSPICNDIKNYTGETPTIKSSEDNYCFYVRLASGEYLCFTAAGFSSRKTTIFPGGSGYCDGITFNCP